MAALQAAHFLRLSKYISKALHELEINGTLELLILQCIIPICDARLLEALPRNTKYILREENIFSTTHQDGPRPGDGASACADEPNDDAEKRSTISLRRPRTEDGPAVTALIAACPPLDPNSAYCNLLQCSHFADSCVVAERDGEIVGWVSGYRPPADPTRFFVWQVAVGEAGRGQGLAGRMIDALLARPQATGVTHVITTITRDNDASWALFRKQARRMGAAISDAPHFERDRHFGGRHATEWQVEIGPFKLDRPAHDTEKNDNDRNA